MKMVQNASRSTLLPIPKQLATALEHHAEELEPRQRPLQKGVAKYPFDWHLVGTLVAVILEAIPAILAEVMTAWQHGMRLFHRLLAKSAGEVQLHGCQSIRHLVHGVNHSDLLEIRRDMLGFWYFNGLFLGGYRRRRGRRRRDDYLDGGGDLLGKEFILGYLGGQFCLEVSNGSVGGTQKISLFEESVLDVPVLLLEVHDDYLLVLFLMPQLNHLPLQLLGFCQLSPKFLGFQLQPVVLLLKGVDDIVVSCGSLEELGVAVLEESDLLVLLQEHLVVEADVGGDRIHLHLQISLEHLSLLHKLEVLGVKALLHIVHIDLDLGTSSYVGHHRVLELVLAGEAALQIVLLKLSIPLHQVFHLLPKKLLVLLQLVCLDVPLVHELVGLFGHNLGLSNGSHDTQLMGLQEHHLVSGQCELCPLLLCIFLELFDPPLEAKVGLPLLLILLPQGHYLPHSLLMLQKQRLKLVDLAFEFILLHLQHLSVSVLSFLCPRHLLAQLVHFPIGLVFLAIELVVLLLQVIDHPFEVLDPISLLLPFGPH